MVMLKVAIYAEVGLLSLTVLLGDIILTKLANNFLFQLFILIGLNGKIEHIHWQNFNVGLVNNILLPKLPCVY